MDVVNTVLGGLVVAFGSGLIGSVITGKNKVSEKQCDTHREYYSKLVEQEFGHLREGLGNVESALKGLQEEIKNGRSS